MLGGAILVRKNAYRYSIRHGGAVLHTDDLLLACDRDLADERQRQCCADCGARLDVANFNRKPRGRPLKLGPEHNRRFSFCCRRDGCRGRATPPSLRFLGRRVYVAAIVVPKARAFSTTC